jgi:hypothetical protein
MHATQDATRIVAIIASLAVAPITVRADDLPVGDGKVSATAQAGYVFACNQNFRGGGARHVGSWFKGDTWDPTEKPHVQGNVTWHEAYFDMTENGSTVDVSGNNLPVGQPTGTFPIATTDPAYQFDTNPNPIIPIPMDFRIPLNPTPANTPSCLSMGMIGFTVTGVAFYNALDDAGRDAAAHEVQDLCDGHPQGKGQYHYHSSSPCLPGANKNEVVGWALDGYPILGLLDASGRQITNADLDACHGRPESVTTNGRTYDYAYRITAEYPYVMGCFTGQVLEDTAQSIRASMGPPKQRNQQAQPNMQGTQQQNGSVQPLRQQTRNANGAGQQRQQPQEAASACASSGQGDSCAFTGRNGNRVHGICNTPPRANSKALVCMR